MEIDYPKEWDELPNRDRKKKIRKLKKKKKERADLVKKARNIAIVLVILVGAFLGYKTLTKKTPEQIEFEKDLKEVSLQGKVEEFEIEGANHVSPGTSVSYDTNPPTSGDHLAQAQNWGVYDEEIDNEAAVHALEHGGIWISYKDISDEEREVLEEIGKQNPQSVIVSPRSDNNVEIAVVSWGRMMKLDSADKALIQKYINTYKNQSPEKLAR